MELTINSDQAMQELGQTIGQLLAPNELILLQGDLGAGKTTFTKGVARALGIKRIVKSPTFTIVREYLEGKMPLFHMDMYRLEDGDISSIDLEDYYQRGGVILMEWPSLIQAELPSQYLEITIQRPDEELLSTKRRVQITAQGAKYQELLAKIKASQPN